MQHYSEELTFNAEDSDDSNESYIDMKEYEQVHNELRSNMQGTTSKKAPKAPPLIPSKSITNKKQHSKKSGATSFHAASLPSNYRMKTKSPHSPIYQNQSPVLPSSVKQRAPIYLDDIKYAKPKAIALTDTIDSTTHEYEELPEVVPSTVPVLFSPPAVHVHKSFELPSEQYVAVSDEMTLGEFVNKYKSEFPVRVRVSRGYYGTTDKWCISEGEYFNIHFVKYTKVVGAVDSSIGNYTIPLNSSVQFGVLPNLPQGRIEEAVTGEVFRSVGDLLAQQTLPLAVKATQNWIKSKAENSVRIGEILILQGTKGRIKRTLKCIEATTGKQKNLNSNCVGNFSTSPHDTCLYLPEVIKHFSLPNNFIMFINPNHKELIPLPQDMVSHSVKLTRCSIETSLIATQLDPQASLTESTPLVEIPIDLDIGVQLVKPKAEEIAQMYEQTNHLLTTFDTKVLQTIPSNIASLQADPTTAEALVTCHKGHEKIGVEIQQPPRYSTSHNRQPHNAAVNIQPLKPKGSKRGKKISLQESSGDTTTETRLQKLESMMSSLAKQIEGKLSIFVMHFQYKYLQK